jgi:NADPH:quinone reductase-like Zn-dependent oxidoreductase
MALPKPKPGPGQILIKIRAAGMNPMDRVISEGEWKATMPGTFPLVLGSDVAGVVEAVGQNTTRFSRGAVVFGQLLIAPLGSAGTYAEYVAVSEGADLVRMPKKLDPVVAASLPTAGVTALEIVQSLGTLAGKTVLIIGAGGGVGSFATQFAAQAGAHVDANTHADAAARMRTYGAAETFDHRAVSLVDAVRRAHPGGIDVVIDLASDRDGFAAVAALVRRGGSALSTKWSADVESLARAGITGVNFQVSMSRGMLERLADAVVAGRIVPAPIKRIKLGDVPKTWSNGHFDGKTVIVLKARK